MKFSDKLQRCVNEKTERDLEINFDWSLLFPFLVRILGLRIRPEAEIYVA